MQSHVLIACDKDLYMVTLYLNRERLEFLSYWFEEETAL